MRHLTAPAGALHARPVWRISAACVVGGMVAFAASALPCSAAEPNARNQASVADTVILPSRDDNIDDERKSTVALSQVLRKSGLDRLDHLGIIDATVDADGCMAAPLSARYPETGGNRHSLAVDALMDILRRRGVVVTLIPGNAVQAADAADQKRAQAVKGSFSLSFGEGSGRWFATKAEMIACTAVDTDSDRENGKAHAPLAAVLAALHQDIVLAVGESQAESKGATWNIIEGALGSSDNGLDAGHSSARITATLVMKDGSTPWSGETNAEGGLRPPLDAQAVAKLQTYLEDELRELAAYRAANPGTEEPPKILSHDIFDAIANGTLDEAPDGSTLGPSAHATLQAAAGRLVDQLQPVLPAR